jgi:phosphatidylglycerophosphatase A
MTANFIPKSVWRNPIHLLAFGLGSGAAPKAPGTFGTLVAVLIYLGLQYLSLFTYSLIVIFSFVFGVYICEKTSRDLAVHDHSGIVWDEFVGYWITMWFAPMGWIWIVVGFLLFRLFDIWKPWPISWCDQKVPGGLGIMLDDVVAGIFALIVLNILAILIL